MSEPRFVATWSFGREACRAGAAVLAAGGAALDAVERGANAVELDPEVQSVGYGGLPNADGVVELDAAIMDGATHRAGAVAALTSIRTPISVARRVMERTPHVMLAGENARRFAVREGFREEELLTEASRRRWEAWRVGRRDPEVGHFDDQKREAHDTVGVCALDARGSLAAGCTTSGLAWKVPGRVGDSPIVGCGLYVDDAVGAAAATGNGDDILRVCLSYRVVAAMERGLDPQRACEEAIRHLLAKIGAREEGGAACIALARDGRIGAAATRAGFRPPERAWLYAASDRDGIVVKEGAYVG